MGVAVLEGVLVGVGEGTGVPGVTGVEVGALALTAISTHQALSA